MTGQRFAVCVDLLDEREESGEKWVSGWEENAFSRECESWKVRSQSRSPWLPMVIYLWREEKRGVEDEKAVATTLPFQGNNSILAGKRDTVLNAVAALFSCWRSDHIYCEGINSHLLVPFTHTERSWDPIDPLIHHIRLLSSRRPINVSHLALDGQWMKCDACPTQSDTLLLVFLSLFSSSRGVKRSNVDPLSLDVNCVQKNEQHVLLLREKWEDSSFLFFTHSPFFRGKDISCVPTRQKEQLRTIYYIIYRGSKSRWRACEKA